MDVCGLRLLWKIAGGKNGRKMGGKIKKWLTFIWYLVIILFVSGRETCNKINIGVWLSLARAPGLGPGGRRFESCHPDGDYAGVVQW